MWNWIVLVPDHCLQNSSSYDLSSFPTLVLVKMIFSELNFRSHYWDLLSVFRCILNVAYPWRERERERESNKGVSIDAHHMD